ncbi:hypothetical protein B296_00037545, partial [Ensete ventricosum]
GEIGKSSDHDSGIERGKKGSSAGVIGNDGYGRSMTVIEGRIRTTKLASQLRAAREGRWLLGSGRGGDASSDAPRCDH